MQNEKPKENNSEETESRREIRIKVDPVIYFGHLVYFGHFIFRHLVYFGHLVYFVTWYIGIFRYWSLGHAWLYLVTWYISVTWCIPSCIFRSLGIINFVLFTKKQNQKRRA